MTLTVFKSFTKQINVGKWYHTDKKVKIVQILYLLNIICYELLDDFDIYYHSSISSSSTLIPNSACKT